MNGFVTLLTKKNSSYNISVKSANLGKKERMAKMRKNKKKGTGNQIPIKSIILNRILKIICLKLSTEKMQCKSIMPILMQVYHADFNASVSCRF